MEIVAKNITEIAREEKKNWRTVKKDEGKMVRVMQRRRGGKEVFVGYVLPSEILLIKESLEGNEKI